MRRTVLIMSLSIAQLGALAVADTAPAETVARAGAKTITLQELETELRPKLIEYENARYEMLREGLKEMIAESLIEQEAAARGVSVDDLLKTEVSDKVGPPTDEEIQVLYEANKEELGGSLEDSRERLTRYLINMRIVEARQAYVDKLREKYPVSISLPAPTVTVGTGSRPPRGGGDNAPVTIVEFADYECPFCKRVEPAVDKVMETYGDKVRLFYRDYPLAFHANARPAAEAAHCANAQGKFWEYHLKLMASEDLSTEKLKAIADEVGIEREKFDACLAKNDYAAAIEQDIKDGDAGGVNGTPAFFINGRLLDGARPFEQFKEIIDEELARDSKS